MDTAPVWVGIDVAKEQLDVALGAEGSTWSMPNDEAGIRALLVELRKHTCALVVLEATGGFEVPAVGVIDGCAAASRSTSSGSSSTWPSGSTT
jgi:transposase